MRRAKVSLGGLIGIMFTYYILTSVLSDAAYVFGSTTLYSTILTLVGFIALVIIALTFILAVKEKDISILLLFALFALIIITYGIR